jgi:disulfide oxidoreductase YuzD
MTKPNIEIKWLDEPEDHDYPAALEYLTLALPGFMGITYGESLRKAPMREFKAKDIFRASGLSLLGVSNSHVKKDRKKILRSEALSPLLLVRYGNNLVIADGYHRLAAVYSFDEDAVIPCKLV